MTPAQLLTLKNAILAEPELSEFVSSGNDTGIANWLNTTASPDFMIWRSNASTEDIVDAITWASLTPDTNPDATAAWGNRAAACRCRQLNLAILLHQSTLNATKANIRQGIQDALTNVPSGIAGALKNAGTATALLAMQRKANRFEKIFSTPVSGANVASIEGNISTSDIATALRGE